MAEQSGHSFRLNIPRQGKAVVPIRYDVHIGSVVDVSTICCADLGGLGLAEAIGAYRKTIAPIGLVCIVDRGVVLRGHVVFHVMPHRGTLITATANDLLPIQVLSAKNHVRFQPVGYALNVGDVINVRMGDY